MAQTKKATKAKAAAIIEEIVEEGKPQADTGQVRADDLAIHMVH